MSESNYICAKCKKVIKIGEIVIIPCSVRITDKNDYEREEDGDCYCLNCYTDPE